MSRLWIFVVDDQEPVRDNSIRVPSARRPGDPWRVTV